MIGSLVLKRTDSTQYGTQGEWIADGLHYCFVLEPVVPVLPAGDYVLNRYWSEDQKATVFRYEIPGNNEFNARCIEAHIGNVVLETEGCSLLGTGWGTVSFDGDLDAKKRAWPDMPGLLGSHIAFGKAMAEIPDGTPITVLPLEG